MKENQATTSLSIDRTKYGIRYGSRTFFDNLGDLAIDDYFNLKIKIFY
jgi:hypothetical protein